MEIAKSVRIREVGPREGFQILPAVYKTGDKLKLIELLSDCGLKEIEVTSFVRKDKVPQMADAEGLVQALKQQPGIKYTALYLNPEGFERAERTGRLSNQAWISAGCSETFLKNNANTDLEKILRRIPEWLAAFSRHNKPLHGLMLSNSFGCRYEGEISSKKVETVVSRIISRLEEENVKLKEVCLADTVGMGSPKAVEEAIDTLRSRFPGLNISLHLHDTNGMGLANAMAGLRQGVDCFDSSIGGIGGCPFTPGSPGNISTEDLVYMCHKMGIETGVNLDALSFAADFLEEKMGIKLNSKYQFRKEKSS